MFGGKDEIAFIFAVFIIHEDDHATRPDLLDGRLQPGRVPPHADLVPEHPAEPPVELRDRPLAAHGEEIPNKAGTLEYMITVAVKA